MMCTDLLEELHFNNKSKCIANLSTLPAFSINKKDKFFLKNIE